MSEGQLPYKDFGIPLGYMYWVVPAMFFKIFGPQLITLVKAQAFINLLSGFAFLSIGKSLKVQPGLRFLGVLLFSLSYSFLNYWPWYNHTVIVYELHRDRLPAEIPHRKPKPETAAMADPGRHVPFLLLLHQTGWRRARLPDLPGPAVLYRRSHKKNGCPPAYLWASALLTALIMILPFTGHGFGYWFNHGQPPHTSRVSIRDIIGEFMHGSMWLKFYLFIIALLLMVTIKNWKEYWRDKPQMIFTLLTLGILGRSGHLPGYQLCACRQ